MSRKLTYRLIPGIILIFLFASGCSKGKMPGSPSQEPEITNPALLKEAENYFRMANIAQAERNHKKAEKLLKKAIELAPDIEKYHFALGHVYDEQCKLDEAAEEFLAGLEIDPESVRSREAFGMILFEQDKLDLAEEEMKKAIEIDPGYARAYETLGNIALKKGEKKKAETYLLKAIKCDPDLVDAYIRLGTLYIDRRDFSRGKSILDKALAVNERLIKKGDVGGHGEESYIRVVMG
ncbi:MAG: tetratricopeptide repeat protein, partial [Candidatus Eremiobacteraeota bacterium]|nr:tetratricopeptide repeat protein [Candidatus Eremiobacteraeota bacterium]